jgi:hypothetical protein
MEFLNFYEERANASVFSIKNFFVENNDTSTSVE